MYIIVQHIMTIMVFEWDSGIKHLFLRKFTNLFNLKLFSIYFL
jgi:hypothetical protein